MIVRSFVILFSFFCISLVAISQSKGYLIIDGGALDEGNEKAFSRMFSLVGGPTQVKIAIIPAASGEPSRVSSRFSKVLERYGVNPLNIFSLPLALEDDLTTMGIDESLWVMNANDKELIISINECNMVWLTGGDQSRLMRCLVPDSKPSGVLLAIQKLIERGGVVGGTSAGAAVMSEVMIEGGTGLDALQFGTTSFSIEANQQNSFSIGTGTGFFKYGIVDQHFDVRSRLGRLMVSLWENRHKFSLGFGVSESATLLIDFEHQSLEVIGKSGLTIINMKQAIGLKLETGYSFENVKISFLEDGDKMNLSNNVIYPNSLKKLVSGNEFYNDPKLLVGGALEGRNSTLYDLLTLHLMDNKSANSVENLTFVDSGFAFLMKLSKTSETRAFYTYQPDENDHFTIIDVNCSIYPVDVNIERTKN